MSVIGLRRWVGITSAESSAKGQKMQSEPAKRYTLQLHADEDDVLKPARGPTLARYLLLLGYRHPWTVWPIMVVITIAFIATAANQILGVIKMFAELSK
jgi:hypothetical protein